MNTNYKLKSELSEDQIEADVASYLGYITPLWSRRFQLKAVDEQLTGADKLFDRFVPIYLQFKVSEGLKPLPFGFDLLSPNRPLQRIRNFRRKNNISANPTLYFKFRDKAKTAKDFQHNILMSFHQPPKQYAMYVAPLFLLADEYNRSLEVSLMDRLFSIEPYFLREERIFIRTTRRYLGLVPFLRGHVSIPPHVNVNTSNHYYSYSKSGGNIAWHSGEKLKGDFRLSTQFIQILQNAYGYENAGFHKEEFVRFISDFMGDESLTSNQNSLDRTIVEFAIYLKKEYEIKLMVLETNHSR